MKCGDCINFKRPMPHGRLPQVTCEQLGEAEDSPSCKNFDQKLGETHPEFNLQQAFHNLALEIFNLNKSADLSINTIRAQLAQQGTEITYNPIFLERTVHHVSEMLTLHYVLLATGMAMYEQEIMSHVIADRFARRDIPSSALAPAPQARAAQTAQEAPVEDPFMSKSRVETAAIKAVEAMHSTIKKDP